MSLDPHPSLPGLLVDGTAFGDSEHSWPVDHTTSIHRSAYLNLSIDTILDPDGGGHDRVVVEPNGAIGVIALDDADRILVVEQYRHPVRQRLIEIPAGTLDVEGESAQVAAVRELSEEADLVAAEWQPLLRLLATPGYSSEHWEVFVATGLSPTPLADRTTRLAEEADMRQLWVPFPEAVSAVFDGRIKDSLTASAILALAAQRAAR